MSVLPIRKYGDDVLRLPTTPVEVFDAALQKLIDDMVETMYAAPGIGLAANQVGVSDRPLGRETPRPVPRLRESRDRGRGRGDH
jgi:peptide deformylase